MLESLYARTMALAAHRRAMWALALVSFAESSVFPVPPDVLIVPMVLAARERAFRIAALCTVASVAGGLAGYAIGYFLMDAVGRPLLAFYGQEQPFARFAEAYNAWGAWIVAGAGLTPFPYKVVTIASGATGLDLSTFTLASLVSRAARFFVEAALLWTIGPPVRRFIERNLRWAATAFFAALFGGYALLRWAL